MLAERLPSARIWIAFAAFATAAAVGLLAGISPTDAIGVAAALAFLPLVLSRFTLGVGIFIVSTFLGISGIAQKGIGFLVILVAVGTLVSDRASGTNFFAAHKRMTALILAFLAWSFLTITWATSTGDVLSSLLRYIPNFLVFFVVYAAARDRRDVSVLVAFFVLGAAVSATDAVFSPPSAADYAGVSRVGGTFGDPNYLAAVLVIGFALSAALSRMRSLGPLAQVSAGIAGGLCMLGILYSVSRGGLIAFGVALVASVLVAGRWRAKLAFATVIVALIAIGYFFVLAPPGARERLTSQADGGSGRTTIWAVGWREVQHNPVKGVGAGNFSVAGVRYVREPGAVSNQAANYTAYFVDTPTVAHNTYLEVLAEEGVPGFALFILILVASLDCTRRAALKFRRCGDEEMELMSYGAFCGTLGFLAASFFLSEEYSKQLYLLLAIGPALLKVATTSATAKVAEIRDCDASRTVRPSYGPPECVPAPIR